MRGLEPGAPISRACKQFTEAMLPATIKENMEETLQ